MVNFEYLVPTKMVFGKGTEEEAGRLIKEFGGHKALIHWGGDYVRTTGLLERIERGLAAEGIEYVEMDGVVPNPRLSLVKEGVELCKKEGVDFVLAIGGGSAIDSSKAIAYGLANDFELEDLFLGKVSTDKIAKIGAISTLAGTGSETSNSTVINIDTMGETMLKRSYNHECARPLFAIMNPELTYSLPAFQTAAPGADIMMHTMERYFHPEAGMALTAAAGPVANLLVAFVAVLLYKILYYTLPASAAINFVLLFLEYMASIAPPTPAKKELMQKAIRLCLARLMPMASAAISSSRMALKARP